jgi:hypothetical protein
MADKKIQNKQLLDDKDLEKVSAGCSDPSSVQCDRCHKPSKGRCIKTGEKRKILWLIKQEEYRCEICGNTWWEVCDEDFFSIFS